MYSDSNFSTSAYTTTLTNPADLLDLRYFKVTTDHETSADSANDGSLDDFKLYNGVSSINWAKNLYLIWEWMYRHGGISCR